MDFFELYRYFLILIVPGFIGALAFSIAARCRTEISIRVALILDLLTFITMLTGLFLFHGVAYIAELLVEFTCLRFTILYTLLSIFINILYGVALGLLRRLFFWIRR